ncbi:WcaI family glycosyltransferase [Sphingomonas desiccabilis]|uniref:Colanic acid biosynthesis glycosyltransferase WcaI n=1 Tax=Sphingomonas desiccabilis TaxID=429134 RepID=A0A4Q2IUC6_9SPHN|nr:WcaI family glycosyltransferase [Sphingomonas desiccabilis]MBB3911075.1 colanic acid biosynthesis glycosyl transferase WcaI [Sphingomonas desiccabilis]RXZ32110.1 colanic acid biosynthesis glycosyltransferase WcaI [Sphingomonas desiccabilis]
MRILILGINHAPEPVGIGPYTAGAVAALAAAGHEVRLVTAKPYYPGWSLSPECSRTLYTREARGRTTVWRCPLYVPRHPSGVRRVAHHLSFALAALPPMLAAAACFRPHLVLTVAPSLLSVPVAKLAARIAGAPLWVHVQDFEVEAAFATGLLEGAGPLARMARAFEAVVLRSAQTVSSISPQMCRRLEQKGVPARRVVEFRNWAEVDTITPLGVPSGYRAEWSLGNRHVALYSGNIANKQGIEILVEAAHRLAHREDIVFVVCGEGPNRARLEARAAGLTNIQFRPLQPAERMGALLGLASVHLLPQLAGTADLVLPSKLANMLASGRPIVATATVGSGLAREVEGCGLVTPPGDPAAMAEAIAALIDDAPGAEAMGVFARARAETRWSRGAILDAFVARVGVVAA